MEENWKISVRGDMYMRGEIDTEWGEEDANPPPRPDTASIEACIGGVAGAFPGGFSAKQASCAARRRRDAYGAFEEGECDYSEEPAEGPIAPFTSEDGLRAWHAFELEIEAGDGGGAPYSLDEEGLGFLLEDLEYSLRNACRPYLLRLDLVAALSGRHGACAEAERRSGGDEDWLAMRDEVKNRIVDLIKNDAWTLDFVADVVAERAAESVGRDIIESEGYRTAWSHGKEKGWGFDYADSMCDAVWRLRPALEGEEARRLERRRRLSAEPGRFDPY